VGHSFSSKEQASFHFMAAVPIISMNVFDGPIVLSLVSGSPSGYFSF